MVAEFEKENPNITVDLVETPTDSYAQVLRTQLQAGNAPDVFYGQPGAGNPNAILPSGEAGYAGGPVQLLLGHRRDPGQF